jgi:transcription elongation factor Elf1
MSYTYVNCPYCGEETSVELENLNEFDNYEAECDKCNKKYIYRCSFSVDVYVSRKEGVKLI